MDKQILLDIKDDIGIITLNRPERMNTMTVQMGNELTQALDELESNDKIRVAILTGAGHVFSAGGDRKAMAEDDPVELLRRVDRLPTFKKPIIAAIERYAVGGGAQVMVLCDLVIAAEGTKIGFVAALAGMLSIGALNYLPIQVGRAKALELMLACEIIDAEEALRIGLINKVVPPDKLMEAAFEMAEKIKRVAPMSASLTKQGVALNHRGLGDIPFIEQSLAKIVASEDKQEASRAFFEKRKPVWKGR